MQLSIWTPQAKKTIESNVVLDKLIAWKIRLAFLRRANSRALGITVDQQANDAWLLGLSSIFNIIKLRKNSAHLVDFLG